MNSFVYKICHPWLTAKMIISLILGKNKFGKCVKPLFIHRPNIFINPKHVYFEGSAMIMPFGRIEAVTKYNEINYNPSIIIGDGVSIQQAIHLTCANKISIGANTNIAAQVTITDINHPYKDISRPVKSADLEVGEVTIGEDCEIYNNAVILPGVHIGKHCIIGAGSVVNSDVPDYSVAVGCPAKVIKHYDFNLNAWVKN